MMMPEAIGAQIRTIRQQRGWTQAALARMVGIQRAQLCKMEQDITCASVAVFLRVCECCSLEIRRKERRG